MLVSVFCANLQTFKMTYARAHTYTTINKSKMREYEIGGLCTPTSMCMVVYVCVLMKYDLLCSESNHSLPTLHPTHVFYTQAFLSFIDYACLFFLKCILHSHHHHTHTSPTHPPPTPASRNDSNLEVLAQLALICAESWVDFKDKARPLWSLGLARW